MNTIVVMGRLTKDPEVKITSTGKKLADFNIAVPRVPRVRDSTDFFKCTAWGKNAETIETYVKKGTKIAITGHLTSSVFKGKDGNNIYETKITVDGFEFAESKAASARSAEAAVSVSAGVNNPPQDDSFVNIPEGDFPEEVPFD